MALETYNKKRDFKKTSEPKGVKKKQDGPLRFVVQKHAASRLHYDFRLEIDGVLVSWAVPKGPSKNPADKRLAVRTEDHPMEYMKFEGTIPKGEYGGGTVMVWDIGTFHAEGNTNVKKDQALLKKQLAQGNIKIELDGKKLKGGWHLVQMKGEEGKNWLLMKSKDEHSGTGKFDETSILTRRDFAEIEKGNAVWHSSKSAAENEKAIKEQANGEFLPADLAGAIKQKIFPTTLTPQLATLADEAFDDPDWIFENKYDGYRALAFINKEVKLKSRNGNAFQYPPIENELQLIGHQVILDGEVVVEDEKGTSRFEWLQDYKDNPKRGTLKYYVFDILHFDGFDLRGLNLIQRKKIVQAVLPQSDVVRYSPHIEAKGKKAFEEAEQKKWEGIIAKRASSKYHDGKRTRDWLKIKTGLSQEVVIAGYTAPQGSRTGIGALITGYYKDGELHYSGKVGSGFTESVLKDLEKKLKKLVRKTSPFAQPPKLAGVSWVKPEWLAQVKFSQWTASGRMRHPVFMGLRQDKPAQKVARETPVDAKLVIEADDVPISHPDKIYFPKEKITKGDVIAYYNQMSGLILPFMQDRPQSLRRTPNGISDNGFFQKNMDGKLPDFVKTRKIKSDSKSESIKWMLCQNRETLLYMANLGCIEMNPWSSRVGSLNNPDYIIFDLDPNKASVSDLVTTAKKVHEILELIGVKGFLKTSGGKGLHVYIPVLPKYTYEQTREFSLLISQMVHRDLSDITSLERMPDKRIGKVYLDFLQNGRGKTMACVYSLRPREGAGVSTPLDWDELTPKFDPGQFNYFTIGKRLEEKGDLWKDFFSDPTDLKAILKNL